MSLDESGTMPGVREGVVVTRVGEESLAYVPQTKTVHRLHPAASAVLRRCDGMTAVRDAGRDLAETHAMDPEAGMHALLLHLHAFRRSGLLAADTPLPKGTGRRQFLARWGAAAAVLLPIMASLTAPAAAQAQSCCVNSLASGCQNRFGAVRLSFCCLCDAGGSCTTPNSYCVTTYTKTAGADCTADTVVSVGCAVMNLTNVQKSCVAARAAVGVGATYFCCEC